MLQVLAHPQFCRQLMASPGQTCKGSYSRPGSYQSVLTGHDRRLSVGPSLSYETCTAMTSSFNCLSNWEQRFSGTGFSTAGSPLVGWLCHFRVYRQLGQSWLKDTHVPCNRCVTSHSSLHTGHVWKRSFRQLSDTMYLTSPCSVVGCFSLSGQHRKIAHQPVH